jgi:4-hydroxybenzoate polyprenyltransferase
MTERVKSATSDISNAGWVAHKAPKWLRPYLRLARMDRPIGIWLLLLPCWWSLSLAASPAVSPWPDPFFFILFAVGAVVMRAAGCTINDIVDRGFDAKVARTASRPIPSGAISVPQALAFLALLLLLGLLVLVQFNEFTILLGTSSLVLVATYPFMKRITYWPQLFLGLTFNWGALLGWAAVRGDIGAPAILLYGAGVLWTLGYDTIYAHQDKEDDILVGVKSTALALAEKTKVWLFIFYGAAVLLTAGAGFMAGLSWAFYIVLVLAAAHLVWQSASVNIDDSKDCLDKFKSNRVYGLIVLIGIIAGKTLG